MPLFGPFGLMMIPPRPAASSPRPQLDAPGQLFLREVVEGCIRYEAFLARTLAIFYEHSGSVYLKHDYYLFAGGREGSVIRRRA